MQNRQFMVFTEKLSVFSEDDLTKGVWIHAAPIGEFTHPLYGKQTIDDSRVDKFIEKFKKNVYGQELSISYEHFGMDKSKGFKAAGWVVDMERRNDGMWWNVKFTPQAASEVKNGEWRYFSPEWYPEWTDPQTEITHTDVPAGGALTNQPFYKNMVPLNFSELAAEVASLPATNEVADWEHSEPGTGPTPRTDNDDDTNANGDRGTSPDVTPPEQDDVEDSMEELLKKLAELLKMEDDKPTEEAVLAAFSERVNQTQPIVEALEKANNVVAFSEAYPTEYAKMQELEKSDRESKAQAFSDRYATARVVKTEGEGDEAKTTDTPFGFSALATEKIKDLHLAFSEGQLTEAHITGVLDAMLNNGMVDYSEHGTARVEETPADEETVKQAFSTKVAELVREDKLDHPTAVRIATEKHPELAKAYAEATRTKR